VTELFSRIDLLREERGLTYRDLARFCGISPQNVQRWKNGGTVMPEHLNTLAVHLRTSVDYLLNGEPVGQVVERHLYDKPVTVKPSCPVCAELREEVSFLRKALEVAQANLSAALSRSEKPTPAAATGARNTDSGHARAG
jgi:transcriptional regulator with XRE-family HTH domain